MCWASLGPTQKNHLTRHCQAVSEVCEQMGRLLGLADPVNDSLRLAGLLHDVGKCAIPESLLAKPMPLSAQERRLMDHHAAIGSHIAQALGADAETMNYIRHHHTPYTITRSTAGPSGSPLPGARVICAADALVSMMSNRPYSKARSPAEALAELRRGAGGQFDPVIVKLARKLNSPAEAA